MVLSEPDISLVQTPNVFSAIVEEDLLVEDEVNETASEIIIKKESPVYEIKSDGLSKLEQNFKQNLKDEVFMEINSFLIAGVGLFFFILLIINRRSLRNSNHSKKYEEEHRLDLDEEFGEIGDPIQARINLAITYIEMKEIKKAKNLLDQVLDSKPDDSQKNQAMILLNNIK